ncbi:MAG TPA: hypothetical protein VK308_16480 [Pyrinomonadaceae bacterium]|nr:hypothetical protein [Pyrinomonadaceae bacterium]
MDLTIKILLLFAGLFLLSGMLTGIWKYRKLLRLPEQSTPVHIDMAHHSSFFYSFACLVIAKLIEYSPFSPGVRFGIAALPLVYFSATIIIYGAEGFLSQSEQLVSERSYVTQWFINGLAAAQIISLILILYGFIYTQFFQ